MVRRTQMKWIATIAATAVVLGIGGVTALVAQIQGDGSTAIAAARAAEPVDSRTPQQILKAFAKAIRAGDTEAMRALVHVEQDNDKRLLDAACSYSDESIKLRATVTKKFGPEVAKQMASGALTPLEKFASLIESSVDKAEVRTEGDYATIDGGHPDSRFILQRIDNGWRISATRMLETWTVQDREQRSGMLIGAADIMARLSQEVGDGKYATAQEFISELQRCFGGS